MSARQAAVARRTQRAAPARVPDEEDVDLEDETAEETSARARKARNKQLAAVTTRVSVRNAPNRGGRQARSAMGRDAQTRGAHQRTEEVEFTEAEIREFIGQEENLLPHVPDTRDWHFKWTRCKLAGKDDGSNLTANLNGKMGYVLVKGPDMLPKGIDLTHLSIRDGDFQGCYQYNDAILMRCPMRNYKLSSIAAERRSRQLNEMLDQGRQAGGIVGETRTGIVVEENVEKTGIREVEQSGEDESA